MGNYIRIRCTMSTKQQEEVDEREGEGGGRRGNFKV